MTSHITFVVVIVVVAAVVVVIVVLALVVAAADSPFVWPNSASFLPNQKQR